MGIIVLVFAAISGKADMSEMLSEDDFNQYPSQNSVYPEYVERTESLLVHGRIEGVFGDS